MGAAQALGGGRLSALGQGLAAEARAAEAAAVGKMPTQVLRPKFSLPLGVQLDGDGMAKACAHQLGCDGEVRRGAWGRVPLWTNLRGCFQPSMVVPASATFLGSV